VVDGYKMRVYVIPLLNKAAGFPLNAMYLLATAVWSKSPSAFKAVNPLLNTSTAVVNVDKILTVHAWIAHERKNANSECGVCVRGVSEGEGGQGEEKQGYADWLSVLIQAIAQNTGCITRPRIQDVLRGPEYMMYYMAQNTGCISSQNTWCNVMIPAYLEFYLVSECCDMPSWLHVIIAVDNAIFSKYHRQQWSSATKHKVPAYANRRLPADM
jgi:hypothetical protein